MRNAFASEVVKLATEDERVVVLSGDIGNNLFEKLKAVGARHFLNCGIAEANMIGVAAGMAMSGLRPIVYTITPFTTTRCFEQIRVDLCYHHAPVLVVGTGSGLSYSELGPTHYSLEDLALLRVLPGMTVMAPCDVTELRAGMRAALQQDGPVYMRIGKKGEADVHTGPVDFRIGKAIPVRPGTDIALLATGTIMSEALAAARLLAERGISAEVVSFHTVKPLDTDYLEAAARRHKLLVTVEEHAKIGGFGGAVAEWHAKTKQTVPHLILGADDKFIHVIGDQPYVRRLFGLGHEQIADSIVSFMR